MTLFQLDPNALKGASQQADVKKSQILGGLARMSHECRLCLAIRDFEVTGRHVCENVSTHSRTRVATKQNEIVGPLEKVAFHERHFGEW